MKFIKNDNLMYLDNKTTTSAKALATFEGDFDNVDNYNEVNRNIIKEYFEEKKVQEMDKAQSIKAKQDIEKTFDSLAKKQLELNEDDLQALKQGYDKKHTNKEMKMIIFTQAQEVSEDLLQKISKKTNGKCMLSYITRTEEEYKLVRGGTNMENGELLDEQVDIQNVVENYEHFNRKAKKLQNIDLKYYLKAVVGAIDKK